MTGVHKLREVSSSKRVDTPKLKRNGSPSTPRVTEKMTAFEATDGVVLYKPKKF